MSNKKGRKHTRILYSSIGTIRRKKTRVERKNIFQLIILIMLIVFVINIQNLMAYFTSSDFNVNEFLIDAEYTVSFNNNGETGIMAPQVISYNVPTNLSSNTFTSTDYIFNGWNTKTDGTGTGYSDGASVTNLGDITLYAQWMLREYNINYILNGGTVQNSNPIKYTVESNTITLNNPVKEGAIFKGWSGTDLEGDTNLIVTIPSGSSGDRTYIAHWIDAEEIGKIKYNSNDGTGSMDDQIIVYNQLSNLTLNTFTKTNYVFKEWNTKSDGSGTRYLDGQEITLSETDTNENDELILYAQWVQGVAIVDGEPTVYTTLQDAINAVPINTEKTVRLLTNVTEFIKVAINQNITLDLQNYTVSESASNSNPLVENKGTLRIINGNLTTTTTTSSVINNESTGRLYISGGRIVNGNGNTGKQAIYNNKGYVEISQNAYISSKSTLRATVQNLASSELVIKGGEIYAIGNQYAVNNEGTLVIGEKDGTSNNSTPVIQSKSTGLNSSVAYSFFDGIIKGKNSAVNNENYITNIEDNHHFLREVEKIDGVNYNTLCLTNKYKVIFNSTGGSSSEEYRFVDKNSSIGFLPTAEKPGFDLVGWFTLEDGGEQISAETIISGDITYYAHWTKAFVAEIDNTRFYTLQEAIDLVPTDNTEKTILLLNNTSELLTISDGQNIVLNLQNNEIRVSSGGRAIDNNGTLSISNGTIYSSAQFGTIDNRSTGVLKISNVNITGVNRSAVYNENGIVEITSGYFSSSATGKSDANNLERATIQNLSSGTITITGGTFVGVNQSAISNEGNLTIGTKHDGINNSSIEIKGKNYGILNVGTINWYDGIVKGITGAISSEISDIEDNSQITTTSDVINEDTYEVKYLTEIE